MKTLIATLTIVTATVAHAINLTFDFTDRDRMGVIGGTHQYLFDELNGTEFLGQKISIDINFAADQFIRIFSITTNGFELALDFQTDYSDYSVFPYLVDRDNTSGYVTGKNGKEIKKVSSHMGGGIGSNFAEVGIFPLYYEQGNLLNPFNPNEGDVLNPYNPNIKTPFDIYGAHFDITLGNYPGTHITSGGFMADSNFEWYSPEFGTAFGIGPEYLPKDLVDYGEAVKWAQQAYQAQVARVPETGSTLALFSGSLILLGLMRWSRKMPRFLE